MIATYWNTVIYIILSGALLPGVIVGAIAGKFGTVKIDSSPDDVGTAIAIFLTTKGLKVLISILIMALCMNLSGMIMQNALSSVLTAIRMEDSLPDPTSFSFIAGFGGGLVNIITCPLGIQIGGMQTEKKWIENLKKFLPDFIAQKGVLKRL